MQPSTLRALALGVVLSASPAVLPSAQAQTVAEMLSWCEPIARAKDVGNGQIWIDNMNFYSGVCYGAFRSMQSAIIEVSRSRMATVSGQSPALICLPPESNLAQIVKVFSLYAQFHPERHHESYEYFAFQSLQMAFPCR